MKAFALKQHELSCWEPQTLERLLEIGNCDGLPDDVCWLWQGAQSSTIRLDRYPDFSSARNYGDYETRVHRLIYQLVTGEKPPPGMVIRHRCDTKPCINPGHVLIGTHADNMRDMRERGRAVYWGKPQTPSS